MFQTKKKSNMHLNKSSSIKIINNLGNKGCFHKLKVSVEILIIKFGVLILLSLNLVYTSNSYSFFLNLGFYYGCCIGSVAIANVSSIPFIKHKFLN